MLAFGLAAVATRHSLLGTHTWYRQTYHGLPVLGGYYARHVEAGHRTVDDGRVAVPTGLTLSPKVSASGAEGTARAALAATTQRSARSFIGADKARSTPATASATEHSRLAVVGGRRARLVWQVTDTGAAGSTESVIDARTGALVSQRSLVQNETGRGQVFSPNPVVALRNENLKDKNDADQAVLDPAYKTLPLTGLDGSGKLRGAYARIVNKVAAVSANGTFRYKRHDDRFERSRRTTTSPRRTPTCAASASPT
jgi:Fungalysin/Thermolysin Propeptide Motif